MSTESASYGDHLRDTLSFYDRLLESNGLTGLVIPSGIPKQQFLDDYSYPFKVNAHFKALLPVIDVPHSYIIYIPGSKPILAFYQPEDYWHVVPSDPEGYWVEHFDVQILPENNLWHTFLPEARRNLAWIGEQQPGLDKLKIGNINPSHLLNPIHYRRACKSEYEVACLQQANLTAAKGHLAAKEAFLSGASEFEIHLAYLNASVQKEEELPYSNIIALNKNGAILHYTDLERRRHSAGETWSFLIDAGASHNGYFSDITRTWAHADGEFNDLIAGFDRLQLELVDSLSVGMSYVDLHILAHLKIAEFLKATDFIFCDPETALDTGISSTFYPHGLGHLLGLQVHDIGGHQSSEAGEIKEPPEAHPFLRLTRVLEPGYCVTIEPGVYFIDLLLNKLFQTKHKPLVNWSKVEAFKKFGGIRIEDDIVLGRQGVNNLTRKAFAQLEEAG